MAIKRVELVLTSEEFAMLRTLLQHHWDKEKPSCYQPKAEFGSLMRKVQEIAKRVDTYDHLSKSR